MDSFHAVKRFSLKPLLLFKMLSVKNEHPIGSIPIRTNRGTLLLSDSISYEEKERWCDQDYLSLNDPNRIFLDSLFRARLADLGMETQTAVRCKRKEKTTISYTDSFL